MARTGLLQQAQEYRYHLDIRPRDDAQADFALVRKHAPATDAASSSRIGDTGNAGEGASPETEDPEVLAEIEGLVAERNRPRGSMELLRGEGRLGLGLPVLVTLLLTVLSAATIFVVQEIFSTREDAITLNTAEVFSTESRLIGEILRSSEEALSAKEAEIAAIESRLSDLAASKAELEENLEDEVALREEELRRELQTELQEERARLQELGTSQAEISEQLAAIEAEREAALASQLSDFRGDLEAEYEGRISELEGQADSLEEQLETERAALQEELSRAEAQATEAQAQASAAQQQLRSLEERSRTISLFQDQLAGSYQAVFTALDAGDFAGAREALDRLNRVFENPSFAGIPSIQDRQEIDVRVAGTIRSLIAREEASAEEQAALQEQLARIREEGGAAEAQIIEEQQARIAALEEENEALNATLEERMAELQARQEELISERNLLAEEQDSLIEERDSLAVSRDTLIAERDSLAAAREGLIEDRDALADARDRLAARLEEQERLRSERVSSLQAEREELQQQVRTLEEELEGTSVALEREQDTVTRLESRIAELESRRDTLQRELAAAVAADQSSSSPPGVPQAVEGGSSDAVAEGRGSASSSVGTSSTGTSSTETSAALRSQSRLRLIGVVTSRAREQILTVRSLLSPGASESAAESGRAVQIRRGDREGAAALVGEGEIIGVSGGVIEILLEENRGVQPADAVFVVED